MDERSMKVAVLGLAIIAVGVVVVCAMGFPGGLFVLLPAAIPHLIQLYRWSKRDK